MSNDTFGLDVVQAAELKYAWERNGGNNADIKSLSSGDMVAQILPILRGYGKVVVSLLQNLGEVAFPGVTNFVASEKFIQNTSPEVAVKISGFGSNFSNWFLGKTETNVAPSRIGYGKLIQRAKDAVIIAFLGGDSKAETSLAEIFHLTSLQPNGEAGVLLNNGWANIFYVCDKDDVLRRVYVFWFDGGWYFYAFPTTGEGEWIGGGQVFSRKVA